MKIAVQLHFANCFYKWTVCSAKEDIILAKNLQKKGMTQVNILREDPTPHTASSLE